VLDIGSSDGTTLKFYDGMGCGATASTRRAHAMAQSTGRRDVDGGFFQRASAVRREAGDLRCKIITSIAMFYIWRTRCRSCATWPRCSISTVYGNSNNATCR